MLYMFYFVVLLRKRVPLLWKLIPKSVETVGKQLLQPTCISDEQWQHFLTQQHHSQMEAFSFSLIWLWIKADPVWWMEPWTGETENQDNPD